MDIEKFKKYAFAGIFGALGISFGIFAYRLYRNHKNLQALKSKKAEITDPDLKLLIELMDKLLEEYAPYVKYYREMYKKIKTQSIYSVSSEAKHGLLKEFTNQCIFYGFNLSK